MLLDYPLLPSQVATVLTACGIETGNETYESTDGSKLQQCLPLAVLKLNNDILKVV